MNRLSCKNEFFLLQFLQFYIKCAVFCPYVSLMMMAENNNYCK